MSGRRGSRVGLALVALVAVVALSACTGDEAPEPSAPSPSGAAVRVEGTWAARISTPHAAAFYFIASNDGPSDDRLVGATSRDAGTVGLYESGANGSTTLVPVDAIVVPAGGSVSAEPGGYEVVLLAVGVPIQEGASLSLVLEFEQAGEVAVDAEVRPFVDPATLPPT